MYTAVVETAFAPLSVTVNPRGVVSVEQAPAPGEQPATPAAPTAPSTAPTPAERAVFERAATQLAEFCAGQRTAFDLPLDPPARTPFVQAVLNATARIPYGETRTYTQVAAAAGSPRAARAVGNALNANPLLLVVPCHRVVAAHGIGGFALGVSEKRWLLGLEQTTAQRL